MDFLILVKLIETGFMDKINHLCNNSQKMKGENSITLRR